MIPGSGRSPGEGKGYPLQYSSLENSMDCMVHEVTQSWTQLSELNRDTGGHTQKRPHMRVHQVGDRHTCPCSVG